jgi:hypothetical protein
VHHLIHSTKLYNEVSFLTNKISERAMTSIIVITHHTYVLLIMLLDTHSYWLNIERVTISKWRTEV